MTDVLLIHLAVLAWLSFGAARLWTDRDADAFLAAGALAWTNLIATALALSAFARLGSVPAVAGVSLALAGLTLLAAWRRPAPVRPMAEATPPRTPVLFLIALPLGLLLLASALTSAHYAPLDPAALARALPDAFRLLAEGRLHPGAPAPLIVAPNQAVLHAWILAYSPLLPTLNFVNLTGWVLAGVAVYQCARTTGCGPEAALIACICGLAALPVLAQAATLDHHLLGAAALLAALGFAGDWYRRRRPASAAFGGLLAGLAAGCGPGLLLTVLGALAGFAFRFRRERGAVFFLPGLAFGLTPPLLAIAAATNDPAGSLALLSASPAPPAAVPFLEGANLFDEGSVGPGLTGFLCLAGILSGLLASRRQSSLVAVMAGLAAAWLAAYAMQRAWVGADSRLLVPAVLLAAPGLAAGLNRAPMSTGRWTAVAAFAAAASLWSAKPYLWQNVWRPLDVLQDRDQPVRQPPDLRAALERPPSEMGRIRFTSDGGERPALAAGAYHIIARSSYAGSTALREIGTAQASLLIPFPDKPTPGVAFLGRVGFGTSARDFLGVPNPAPAMPADASHSAVLVTVSEAGLGAPPPALRLDVIGLHALDGARLEVTAEATEGAPVTVACLSESGVQTIPRDERLARLRFRLVTTADGVERGTAELDDQSAPGAAYSDNDPRRIFFAELVSLRDPSPVRVDPRLLPPEGPFPQLQLPQIRWMRAPTITLRLPPSPEAVQWRLTASTRLQLRPEGLMEILGNGTPLRRIAFDNPATWQEIDVTFPAVAGENSIEIRDLPLPPEPDWLEYLDRYSDVRRYLELTRRPLIGGAREHYESSGRAEGRTVVLMERRRPAEDAFYYLFRSLRVEGLKR